MYLLENKTFYYTSSFGNVDLELYGEYALSDQNVLSLQMDEELTKGFYFYGLNNGGQNNKITLLYDRPYNEAAEKLFVVIGEKHKKFPNFTPDRHTVSITIKSPKSNLISIGYKNPDTRSPMSEVVMTEMKLLDGINEVKIYHNYYADMAVALSNAIFHIENGVLKESDSFDQRTTHKEEIAKTTKNEIMQYIKAVKSRTFIVREEKKYYKL